MGGQHQGDDANPDESGQQQQQPPPLPESAIQESREHFRAAGEDLIANAGIPLLALQIAEDWRSSISNGSSESNVEEVASEEEEEIRSLVARISAILGRPVADLE